MKVNLHIVKMQGCNTIELNMQYGPVCGQKYVVIPVYYCVYTFNVGLIFIVWI